MSTDTSAVIGNASDIIDRFGGIRPMANKTGIPVTTIQGWKQRNAIPANRRYELIEAANKSGIHLGNLLEEIAGIKSNNAAMEDEELIQHEKIEAAKENPDLRPAGNQATLIAAGALILVAAIGGTFLAMAPQIKSASDQTLRIKELEQQIAAMRNAKQAADDEELAKNLQYKISTLESKVGQLTEQAKSYASIAQDLKTGTVAQRLNKIEGHVGHLLQKTKASGLQNLFQTFQSFGSNPEGSAKAESLMSLFIGAGQGANQTEDVGATFAQLKETNPQVAETFKDVPSEDMKAAVMLLGMTQLRESLARDNNSFDQDLQILKMTMAKDDPELQAAIDRLAPKAKVGVLTPSGLSKQLRGLTGDIVSASLTGKDISIEDRAKARFGDVIKVEKNGVQVSGTETQITIAEAQKRLDVGDVEGAVTLLQQIQGPAAEKTRPILDSANATLLASQVQQMIGKNLIQTLSSAGQQPAPYTAQSGGVGQILNQVKTTIGSSIGGNP